MPNLPPLSLYIHIPWCVRKCPYCDFNSHKAEPILPEDEYVEALIQDLTIEAQRSSARKLHSIFIGGGTPSLFSASSIEKILNAAENNLGFEHDIEITLEANPGTFEQAKFQGFKNCGINRLSIGIQSFNDTHLQRLGRIHKSAEAHVAISIARRAGFDNINLDLMHGLPQQSTEQALEDLQIAIELKPEHLSWYQLTIEPNTEFHSNPPPLPLDDTLADIQERGQNLLLQAGFQHYEVSAFAQHNRRSQHNLNYWRFGDYIGIGAGAHGKLSYIHNGKIVIERRHKTRQPNHYLAAHKRINGFLAGHTTLDSSQLPLEFVMNALRLVDGVALSSFNRTTGLPLSSLEPQRQQLVNRGLLTTSDQHLQTTPLGQRFLNDVLAAYMDA